MLLSTYVKRQSPTFTEHIWE